MKADVHRSASDERTIECCESVSGFFGVVKADEAMSAAVAVVIGDDASRDDLTKLLEDGSESIVVDTVVEILTIEIARIDVRRLSRRVLEIGTRDRQDRPVDGMQLSRQGDRWHIVGRS